MKTKTEKRTWLDVNGGYMALLATVGLTIALGYLLHGAFDTLPDNSHPNIV